MKTELSEQRNKHGRVGGGVSRELHKIARVEARRLVYLDKGEA